MDELLPFLRGKLSKNLEHELVSKAIALDGMAKSIQAKMNLLNTIDETISSEVVKPDYDEYLLKRLMMIKSDIQFQIKNLEKED